MRVYRPIRVFCFVNVRREQLWGEVLHCTGVCCGAGTCEISMWVLAKFAWVTGRGLMLVKIIAWVQAWVLWKTHCKTSNDGIFVPEHFRSGDRKVHRENFRSRGTFVPRERKFLEFSLRGTFASPPRVTLFIRFDRMYERDNRQTDRNTHTHRRHDGIASRGKK